MLTNKNEVSLRRLKGKKRIEHLFRVGDVLHSKHLLLRYLYFDQGDSFQLGVSVAKRSFNRAHDRNRIKRQMREALWANKNLLTSSGLGMFVFKGRVQVKTEVLISECEELFKRLSKNNTTGDNA